MSAEEVADLVFKARHGDKGARDALILQHLPLCKRIKDQEQRGAALLKLVVGVDEFLSSETFSTISAFLKVVVANAVKDSVRNKVREDVRVKKFAGSRPGKMKTQLRTELQTAEKVDVGRRRDPVHDRLAAHELLEKACVTSQERILVQLLVLGHSQTEAGNIMGLHKVHVGRLLAKVKERIKDA